MKIKKISQNMQNYQNNENIKNNPENKNYTVRSMLSDLKKWEIFLKDMK